jgi:uncharacterized protein
MKDLLHGIFFLLLMLVGTAPIRAAEVIPPAPEEYLTDQSGKLSSETIQDINAELDQFEKATSNQIVVAIYPHMQSDDDIAAYAVRVFRAWKIGEVRVHRGNGALLLIFTDDEKVTIAPGYGLEGALPDVTCKQIIDNEITPAFKKGDYDAGVTAGVNAIIAATKGEYTGNGSTVYRGKFLGKNSLQTNLAGIIVFVVFAVLILSAIFSSHGTVYHSGGTGSWLAWGLLNVLLNSLSVGGGGRNWSGGGGGGFSGGGGSTGGGGASGSW